MARLERVSPRCRIFVSYAHLDENKKSEAVAGCGYPRAFIKYLRVSLKPLFEPERPEDYVFFDLNRLASEPAWGPAIEKALNECELFIFLVSVNSLDSTYCMQKELITAVKRRIPIIPVLLTPIDGWREYVVADPGHPPRRLSDHHTGGLPKDGTGNLLPVSQWKHDEELAWNSVCADIVTFIKAGLKPANAPRTQGVSHSFAPSGKALVASELLPYFCDQGGLISHCKMSLTPWGKDDRNTLFLFLKGGHEDGMDCFARRMLREVIQPRLPAHLSGLVPQRTLVWPHFNPRKRQEAEIQMADALLQALGLSTESAYDGRAAEVLRMHLDARPDVPIVHLFLPENADSHKAGLSALLDLIESASLLRGRLILLLFIQDIAPLIARPNLTRAWGLNNLKRSVVVEPPALGPVTGSDVKQWHETQEIEQHFGIRLSELKARLFPDPAHTHRLRSFAEHFERLRAQPRGDPP